MNKMYKQFISIILSVSLVGTCVPAYAGGKSFLAVPGMRELNSSLDMSRFHSRDDEETYPVLFIGGSEGADKSSVLRLPNAEQIPNQGLRNEQGNLKFDFVSYKWRKRLAVYITLWHTGLHFSLQHREAGKILDIKPVTIVKKKLIEFLGLLAPDQKKMLSTIELNNQQIKAF